MLIHYFGSLSMPKHFILRIGNYVCSVVLKEKDSSDIELILLTDYNTGKQVSINENDIACVFQEIRNTQGEV
jgi:hypothetical protein